MHATYDQHNKLINDPKQNLRIQSQFYQKLYTSDSNIRCTIKNKPDRVLSNSQREALDCDLSLDEITTAVKEMAKDKTPGTSGFQVNLYVMFWMHLKKPLYEAFKFAHAEGQLNSSARYGLISLIPKKERDLNYVKNWRPIILFNTDYKILAKVMANRLKAVISGIVHNDQTGFIKSRLISTNLRKILDIMEHTKNENLAGILVAIDFEKAFDRVEYSALLTILKWFNCGEVFCSWVKLLFTDIKLATLNNGYTSQYFTPSRALFQGNPITSFLFVIVIKLLATQLRQNEKIKGIKIQSKEILMCLFADDLALLLEYGNSCWENVVYELNVFQKCTGMLINYEKTEVYRMGSIRDTNAMFYAGRKLNWTNDPIRILGFVISYDVDQLVELNIAPLISKSKAILARWQKRDLSLSGKVQIINSLVASMYVCRLAVLPTLNESTIKPLSKCLKNSYGMVKEPKFS